MIAYLVQSYGGTQVGTDIHAAAAPITVPTAGGLP